MNLFQRQRLKKISTLMEVPAPDPQQLVRRIEVIERNIILPVKLLVVSGLVYFLYFTRGFNSENNALDIAIESLKRFVLIYGAFNLAAAPILLNMRRLPLALLQWSIFTIFLMDGFFLAALTFLTGGYDSILFWLFLGLIVRNAISVPAATSQLVLNFATSLCYVLAGIFDVAINQQLDAQNLQPTSAISLDHEGNTTESLLLRVTILVLMTLCCYGLRVLLQKQQRAIEEAHEFALRQEQLRSAGRLAAEIAHQIKNPLGIINNAAFSLKRALASGNDNAGQQIQIIQEEVERSDRIITQLMGYAALAEGRVERLQVIPELDRAIAQVLPEGVAYDIKVHRDFGNNLPPLMMQRTHLSEIFVNLLQNAREALNGKGNIFVSAQSRPNYTAQVVIRDDGPGIAPESFSRIFDAYYTKKEKGTGLGLAIVKHNVELYNGTIRVESELGKGAAFTLLFPARTLEQLGAQT